ncbi:MAG: Zn-ribbon domain-containing OB-fold protein [Deltaproteobacteria bacterium]|nr:Zn-ribbon domain-containing OB-fold protein [Deltaproteobacteria bacterium]
MAERRSGKPLPRVDEESKGYWEACRRHELRIQKCLSCGTLRHQPRAVCTNCLSSDVEWLLCSGRGEVYTFTVTYQNQTPGFRESLPYVLAYVTLEEGVQMLTNVVDCPPDQVRIGLPVEVAFEDVTDEIAIPRFRPRGGSGGGGGGGGGA